MKAVIRFIVELHGVQTRLRNYWLSIESLANSVGRNCPPPPSPPPPPPPSPPCPAAEKLIVDACKRDAQRFIIWKLEGPLTKAPPPFFFILEEPNPLFARDVLLLWIKKKKEEENTFEYSSRCNPRDLRWNHGGWIIIHGDNWVLRNFNNFIWLDNS